MQSSRRSPGGLDKDSVSAEQSTSKKYQSVSGNKKIPINLVMVMVMVMVLMSMTMMVMSIMTMALK